MAKGTVRLTPCRPTGSNRPTVLHQGTTRVASGLGAASSLPHRRVPVVLALYLFFMVLLWEGQEPQRASEFWRALLLIRCGDVHLNPGPAQVKSRKEFWRMGSVCDMDFFPLMSFRGWHQHRQNDPKRLNGGFANVRTLSVAVEVATDGSIASSGLDKIELIKHRMRESNLYYLALAETRMDESGQIDCGDGFLLLFHNKEGWKGRGGVGIMLSPAARKAWLKGGERVYCHPSGRVMSCSILLGGKEGLWHVLAGYGPANSHGRPVLEVQSERMDYFQALDDTIKKVVRSGDFYVLAADMNCRVGRRAVAEDGFRSILGRYGLGRRNAAGRFMLDFCSQRQLAVANSFYEHDVDHTATWHHPCFKLPAVLDYMLVREQHRQFVEDVRAFPGLDISSDHTLVILRLVARPLVGFRGCHANVKREGRLPRIELSWPADSEQWSSFRSSVRSELSKPTVAEGANMGLMCDLVRECAENTLGTSTGGTRGQWRIGREKELDALSQARSAAWRALRSQKRTRSSKSASAARAKYKHIATQTRLEVKSMVNVWWSEQLERVEHEANTHNSRALFNDVKDLMNFVGLESSRKALAMDADAMRTDLTEHFTKVLSIQRPVNWEAVRSAPSYTCSVDWSSPSKAAIRVSLFDLRDHRGCGLDGVPTELLKAADLATTPSDDPNNEGGLVVAIIHRALCQWFSPDCSSTIVLPESWLQAVMIALFKNKGDRGDLDNWRGIWLLSVCSKICSKLLNNRLRELGEMIFGDQNCGFRAFRGCPDDTFTIRRILEEIRSTYQEGLSPEMDPGLYALFADLAKAFDSVPRDVLWYLLEVKLGIPSHIVRLIKEFHEGLRVRVLFRGALGDPFPTGAGVRQGCIKAPTLWNIYFHFVMECWRHRYSQAFGEEGGVPLRTTVGIPFESRARVLGRFGLSVQIRDVIYADDTALLEPGWSRFVRATQLLDQVISEWGGELSLKKTEWMWICGVGGPGGGADPGDSELFLRGRALNRVEVFPYLGSLVGSSPSLGVDEDITRRISLASNAMGRLKLVWSSDILTRATKSSVLLVLVASTLLWGAESWPVTDSRIHRLRVFWGSCVRRALGISYARMWKDHISYERMYQMLSVDDIWVMWERKIATWLGHVSRMDPERYPSVAMFGHIPHRVAPAAGAPRTGTHRLWVATARRVLKDMGMQLPSWRRHAEDRTLWRACSRTLGGKSLPPQFCAILKRDTQDEKPFHCHYCDWTGKTQNVLTRHERRYHSDVMPAAMPASPPPPCHWGKRCRQPRHGPQLASPPAVSTRVAGDGKGKKDEAAFSRMVRLGDSVCPYCERSFSTRGGLTQHMKLAHSGTGVCHICGVKIAERYLTQHLSRCEEKQAGRELKTVEAQQKRRKRKMQKIPAADAVQQKRLNRKRQKVTAPAPTSDPPEVEEVPHNPSARRKRMASEAVETKQDHPALKRRPRELGNCRICGHQFTACYLPRHEAACKNREDVEGDEGFECTICHGKYASMQTLSKHRSTCKGLSCPHCGTRMDSSRHVANHVIHCPQNPGRPQFAYDPVAQPYYCSCGTHFTCSSSLSRHQKLRGCGGGGGGDVT